METEESCIKTLIINLLDGVADISLLDLIYKILLESLQSDSIIPKN